MDAVGHPADARAAPAQHMVFLGSSSITKWSTLAVEMAPIPVINRGFGASMIVNVADLTHRLLPPEPLAVVLSAGSNDLT